ncbi:Xaa-Pro dipeptidase [Sphingomonas sp. 37zxx]|uniref:Xaa-Pro dipeptidase n=1 Tax=Sphingomonas sp. 37zxx TaxID=1550073 RepID=UPI00053C0288|nr:amidohydrolase family protein [Sphingomonas sp. 37zxx]
MRLITVATCVTLASAGMASAQTAPASRTTVITAARMIDVVAGRVIEEPVIVITDGRVSSVVGRNGGRPDIPADAQRIDLPGKTLLPGFIDMHVHLAGSARIRGYKSLEYTDVFPVTLGVGNARDMLHAGFTTVRNLGAADYADVALKQGIEGGFYPGPRIVPATWSFGATGGHCGGSNLLPPRYKEQTERGVNGAEAVRYQVRENRRFGAEVIKVCATGGVFSKNTEPGQQQMTADELKAAADEAHMWGLKVAAHAHGADGIKAAIRAGIDTIEHASLIDDEGLRLAKERGTWLSMDIFNTEYTQREGAATGALEENLRKDREVAQVQRDNFAKAVRMGIKLVFGSDAGVMPHDTAAGQFATMVQFGMTPMQAIQAATTNAAQALGRERDVGAIAVGRYGDIVAVDGDPLADIRVLERVSHVVKGGVLEKGAVQ